MKMNVEQARFNMIEQQIRPWDVLDSGVLQLLSVVKREDFVPPAHKALAFADMELPLRGNSEEAMRLGQCMLAPRVEARMLQDVAVQPNDKVLEIGTGSGYMAALLAQRAQRVISLEIDPELVTMARDNLQHAGIHNVEVRHADGAKGVPVEGPFDVIVLSGSVAEIPHKLLEHLKRNGGRLMAIVGDAPVMRATLVTRTGEAEYRTTQGWDTVAPRLLSFPEHSRFNF
jgi:protein-L-isoaspartate(D-aspartate) O-methyltransferase